MKIKRVSIKNMNSCTDKAYDFQDLNYIQGPNGSGKSTVLQAIHFCLFGYIPGTNKTSGAIYEHFCNQAVGNEMMVTVEIDDPEYPDLSVTRYLSRSKDGKYDTDCMVGPCPEGFDLIDIVNTDITPTLNFSEFTSLSGNKQKEALFALLPSFDKKLNTKKLLKEVEGGSDASVKSIVDDLSKEHTYITSISDIDDILKEVKELKKGASSEEKRLTSLVQSLVFYDDYDGPDDLQSLKTELDSIVKRRDAVISSKSASDRLSSIKEEISKINESNNVDRFEDYDRCINDLQSHIDELTSKLSDLADDRNDLQLRSMEVISEISRRENVLKKGTICPILSIECDSLLNHQSTLKDVIDQLQAENDEIMSSMSNIDTPINELKSKIDQLKTELSNLNNSKDRIHALNAEISRLNVTSDPLSLEELTEQFDILQDQITKLSANKKYEEMMKTVETERNETFLHLEYLKRVESKLGENGLKTDMMDKPVLTLQKTMAAYLVSMKLKDFGSPKFIFENKNNSFKYGVVRDNNFVPFNLLSSGEQCIFLLVFLSAIASIGTSNLKVVMVDDLLDHLDDEKFKTVINSMNQLDGNIQYIFAGIDNAKAVVNGSKEGVQIIELK